MINLNKLYTILLQIVDFSHSSDGGSGCLQDSGVYLEVILVFWLNASISRFKHSLSANDGAYINKQCTKIVTV